MKRLALTGAIIISALSGCTGGGGSGSDPAAAPVPTQPSQTSNECNGSVTFYAPVPADVPSVTASNDTPSTPDSTPGIGNPAVSKYAKRDARVAEAIEDGMSRGLRVVSQEEKADGSVVITFCGGTSGIGGDTSNSNNTSNPAPSTEAQ